MKHNRILLLLPILLLTSCGSKAEGGITFDANGGTFADGSTSKNYHGIANEAIFSETNSSSLLTPTNGELIFKGWYENAEGKGSAINIDALKYPYYVDYKLFAGWASEVSVSYYTGIADLTYPKVKGYEGKGLTLPEPSLAGYTFYGWYTDQTFTTEFNKKVFPSTDLTLYAKFEEYPTITLVYPSGENVSYQAKSGTAITKSFTVPSLAGSTFAGWYKDREYKEQFFFDYMPGVSTNLYPKFVKTVRISFVTNCDATLQPLVGAAESKIVEKPEVLVKADHSFSGWYKTASFEVGSEFSFETFPLDDLTLYGKWDHYPVLSFTSADPSISIGTIEPISLAGGTLLGKLPTPQNNDYEFLGWYYNNGTEDVLFDSIFMPTTSLTLKAHFQIRRKITIVEKYNGQTVSTTNATLPTSHDIITGQFWDSIYTTSATYVSNGLYTDENLSEASKINLPNNPTGNITIYVKLAKIVTLNFYDDNEMKLTISGGEQMVINESVLAQTLKVEGMTIEGFYYDQSFTNNFPIKVFPSASGENITNIYIRYLSNN